MNGNGRQVNGKEQISFAHSPAGNLSYSLSQAKTGTMSEINKLLADMLKEIEQLRIGLNVLSRNKTSLVDPEVIEASKKLDDALNEYARLSRKWKEPPNGQD